MTLKTLVPLVRRAALLVGAVLLAPLASATAQGGLPAGPLKNIEVDRIVAIVGKHPVLFSEVLEAVAFARSQGLQLPADSAGQMAVAREMLGSIVDKEVLLAVAKEYKIEVGESDVSDKVEQNLDRIRSQFPSEEQFRAALKREGFGTPEEYRKKAVEGAIRDEEQRRVIDSLKAKGRLAQVNVTESEVSAAFEKLKSQLPPRPATVAFRQIVVKLTPRLENVLTARVAIDSIRVALEKGADFDSVAKARSMDEGSAQIGGDLGWNRRGKMVPEFDRMMFALLPGRISPVVETEYGFHIMRVDRVRAAEVRARHVLIMPTVDSTDLVSAKARADSALALWKAGMVSLDTLIAKYHDRDEERTIPEGFPRDSLPAEYRVALKDVKPGQWTGVFALPDRRTGLNKWAIAQVISEKPAGEYTLEEHQENVRKQLREEKSIRRTLDNLRRELYVSLRL